MTIDEMPATSACFWEMEAVNGQEHVSPVNSSIRALRRWMLRHGIRGGSRSTFLGLIPRYLGIAKVAPCSGVVRSGPLNHQSHACGGLCFSGIREILCRNINAKQLAFGGCPQAMEVNKGRGSWCSFCSKSVSGLVVLPPKLCAAAPHVDTSIFQWFNVPCPRFFCFR